MESHELLVTGYAKLPQGITATALYSVIAVGLIVESKSGVIMDADCTLATDVAKEFVRKILVGKSLNDLTEIEESFRLYYHGSARKALISSVRICSEKYKQIIEAV